MKENSLLKTTSGFIPDVVVLNRNMTSHIPDTLENLKQEIVPSPLYGWHSRQKFQYFEILALPRKSGEKVKKFLL